LEQVLVLPPYDIRVRRELAQRRLIVSIIRHALRVATLHVFDALAVAASAIVVTQLTQIADGRRLWPALVGLVLIGLNANGAYRAGEALDSVATATTVRVRDGKTLTTDGPFAETKEALGGFYIVEAADLDEAIRYAAAIPGAMRGSIEVRPIFDWSAQPVAATAASSAAS
jgi:hypothetical protein